MQEVINDLPVLIYCFSGSGCNSCIKHEIKKIKKVFSKRSEQVILIMTNSNMVNPRELFLFKKINKLDFPIYYSAKLSSIQANNFYFILKPNGEIILPFFSSKDLPKLAYNYLQFVQKRIINNDKIVNKSEPMLPRESFRVSKCTIIREQFKVSCSKFS